MIGASDEWLYFHKAKYDPGYIRSGDKEPSYDDTIYRIKKDGSKKEIVYEKKETWDLLHYQGVWCMNDWIVYILSLIHIYHFGGVSAAIVHGLNGRVYPPFGHRRDYCENRCGYHPVYVQL